MTENKNAPTRELNCVELNCVELIPEKWGQTSKTPLQHCRGLEPSAGVALVDVDPARRPQSADGQTATQLSEEAACE